MPWISSSAYNPNTKPSPGTIYISASSALNCSACFSKVNSTAGASSRMPTCAETMAVYWSLYRSMTARGSVSSKYPSGAVVSTTSYSPRYSALLTALPSLPVVTVSATSPALSFSVPSGVLISVLARISNTAPSSGISEYVAVLTMPKSDSVSVTPVKVGPVFFTVILPMTGVLAHSTTTVSPSLPMLKGMGDALSRYPTPAFTSCKV